MGYLQNVTSHARDLVTWCSPIRLLAVALEKSTQLAADVIDSVVGVGKRTDGPGQVGSAEGEKVGEKAKSDDNMTTTTPARTDGYLTLSARVTSGLLRRLQKWLQSLRETAPSAGSLSPPAEEGRQPRERRRLVAKKPLDKLGRVAWILHCALYALTDTLDDVGVRVELLEYVKGTLQLSGDESIDGSPIKERTVTSPAKRKDWSDDEEDEEEEAEDELNLVEQLDQSYDSAEDEDYQPPDEVPSSGSEEYGESATESEASEKSGDEQAKGQAGEHSGEAAAAATPAEEGAAPAAPTSWKREAVPGRRGGGVAPSGGAAVPADPSVSGERETPAGGVRSARGPGAPPADGAQTPPDAAGTAAPSGTKGGEPEAAATVIAVSKKMPTSAARTP